MATGGFLLSEDHCLCSICLDVFIDPVSTPCGHNFCQTCINQNWDTNVQYKCPNCKEAFSARPNLKVNTFISQISVQFRQSAQQKGNGSSKQQAARPGDIPCDVCAETKLKAVKSCFVCLASYCETHLEPHMIVSRLIKHALIDPVENLENRMCTKHDKPLELFCRDDEICVCTLCTYSDHKKHDVVPLKSECKRKKVKLGKTESGRQQMIRNRRLKIDEIKHFVELSNTDADRAIARDIQVFVALKESVEKAEAVFLEMIIKEQKMTERKANLFLKELEGEISELMKRSNELQQLLGSKDQLHLIQNFSSLNSATSTKDWTEVRLQPPTYEGTLVRALAQLEKTLNEQMKKVFEAEMRRVQQYAVNVTLDPASAHPHLLLSDGGRQVKHNVDKKKLPDKPKTFEYLFVLGKTSFSSGRFYYEAQVKDKTWWILGVAAKSVNRKGEILLTPQNGFWTICLQQKIQIFAFTDRVVRLFTKSVPEKVGVFVDYEEGLVSFYDVNAAALLYSFTNCSFNDKLYPFCSPGPDLAGINSAPLIICRSDHLRLRPPPPPPIERQAIKFQL